MKILITGLSALCLLTIPTAAQQPVSVLLGQPGAVGHEAVHDVARSRIYVSVPSMDQVAIVDTNTWTLTGHFVVSPAPYGIALSIDGEHLYVAKRGAGAVEVIELSTGIQSEIDVMPFLGYPTTHDVIEGQPGKLYVSSDADTIALAYIVEIDLTNGNAVRRVASNHVFRSDPEFAGSRDFTALYIGQSHNPASIYKLALSHPDVPIVAQSAHGSLISARHIEVAPDGDHVHLAWGQIVETITLDVQGQIGPFISRFGTDPDHLFVLSDVDTIETWHVPSRTLLTSEPLPCSLGGTPLPRELIVLPGDSGFIVLRGNELCGFERRPGCPGEITVDCEAELNSTGVAGQLRASGDARITPNNLVLELDAVPPGGFALFAFGAAPSRLPMWDGWLCLSPAAGVHRLSTPIVVDSTGAARLSLDLTTPPLVTAPVTEYTTWYFQAWYRDAVGPGGTGANTSNSLRITFCP